MTATEWSAPPFLTRVRNIVAGQGNPHREGYFLKTHRVRGRLNPGVWATVLFDDGDIGDLPPTNLIMVSDQPRRVQPSREDLIAAIAEASPPDFQAHILRLRADFKEQITDAVLDLFAAQPTVEQVKVEALRESASDEVAEWARKQVEDELVELRDGRISMPFRRNGLVIAERDGEPSHIVRLGFEMAWRKCLTDRADLLVAEAGS